MNFSTTLHQTTTVSPIASDAVQERGARYIREVTNPPLEFIDKSTGEILSLSVDSSDKSLIARQQRYYLQDCARKVLYKYFGDHVPVNKNGYENHHRTCTCGVKRITSNVQVVKSKEHKKAFFSGVATCANSRTCAVCAAIINERKANEIRFAMNQADALGVCFSMMTFTVPHFVNDKLSDLLDKIKLAHAGFWRGAPAAKFKKRYGIIGHIRSLEIRHGSNGWHPHFHILVVSKVPLPTTVLDSRQKKRFVLPLHQQSEDFQWILKRWQTLCVKHDLKSPNLFGLDILNGLGAGEYVCKFGGDGEILKTAKGKMVSWDFGDEMTKGNVKSGSVDSKSPWQVLADAYDMDLSENERFKNRLVFLDYARSMHGQTLLKWSRKLKSFFGLNDKELSDDQILAENESLADLLCFITPNEWVTILHLQLRTKILEIAEQKGKLALAQYIFSCCCDGSFDNYYNCFINRHNDAGFSLDNDQSCITHKYINHEYKKVVKGRFIY